MKRWRQWSSDEDALLRQFYADWPNTWLASRFGRSDSAIQQRANALGLKKSARFHAAVGSDGVRLDGRFAPGIVPANKGLRRPGWYRGRMRETQFRKGRAASESRNYVPIGSLRLSKDGYLMRKVTDDPSLFPARRWVAVHRLVWEAVHGRVPPGHVVVFLPGRRTTDIAAITIDSVELVSRAELMRRNSYHTRYPKEVALLIQLKGALNRKINSRSKA